MIRNCKYDTQTIHGQCLTKLLRRFGLPGLTMLSWGKDAPGLFCLKGYFYNILVFSEGKFNTGRLSGEYCLCGKNVFTTTIGLGL